MFGTITQAEEQSSTSPQAESSAVVTNLAPAKDAKPEQEVPAPDPETSEVQEEQRGSASLPVEAFSAVRYTPVYRVYNPNSGEHLHTLNGNEKDSLMSIGWVYEGVSMQIDGSGNNLYRAYNPNSGEHFYSKDYNEINKLKRAGWRYEGVAWKTPNSGMKVYRLFNPNSRDAGSHHYTLTESEKKIWLEKGGDTKGFRGQSAVEQSVLSQRMSFIVFLMLANIRQ